MQVRHRSRQWFPMDACSPGVSTPVVAIYLAGGTVSLSPTSRVTWPFAVGERPSGRKQMQYIDGPNRYASSLSFARALTSILLSDGGNQHTEIRALCDDEGSTRVSGQCQLWLEPGSSGAWYARGVSVPLFECSPLAPLFLVQAPVRIRAASGSVLHRSGSSFR
jgi:hypothetical protein